MKKHILLLFIILLAQQLIAQPSYFQKTFGDTLNNNVAKGVAQAASGSIYVVGNANDLTAGKQGISLIKLNAAGIIQWNKLLVSDRYACNRMMLTQDENLLIVGQTTDSTGNTDALVIKCDTAGTIIFIKTYGRDSTTEAFQGIDVAKDGGFVFSGFTTNPVGTGNAFYLAKTESDGTLKWNRSYGFAENSSSDNVRTMPDGSYVLTGDKKTVGPDYNPHLIRVDSVGNVIWETNIDNKYNSGCKNIMINAQGFILVIGESATATSTYFDPFITKVDTGGNIIWSHTIPCTDNSDAGYDIIEPTPDNYFITGFGYDTASANTNLLVMRLDSLGNEVTRRYYGGAEFTYGYDITEAYNHSGFLATGFNSGGTESKYYLVYDSLWGITSDINEQQAARSFFTAFPNPCSDNITIHLEKRKTNSLKVNLSDLFGKELFEQTLAIQSDFQIPVSNLATGVYIISLSDDESIYRRKIIVEH